MKTLYLSDLDGTLLRSDERISEYTAGVINRLVENGGYFSYATARSFVTASKVTSGLSSEFPVICYNGTSIINSKTREIISAHDFTQEEMVFAVETFDTHGVYPIVYAYIDGAERFSYIERCATPAMKHFLDNRIGDPRRREVDSTAELYSGSIFYFSCIGVEESLFCLNDVFCADSRFNCIYGKDFYSDEQWCELLPAKASKANAALELKELLGCDILVAFGDGRNDLSLFSVADECYAMSNAVPELKETATDVIESNDNDGVANWIAANVL